jgi:hypothetical protein
VGDEKQRQHQAAQALQQVEAGRPAAIAGPGVYERPLRARSGCAGSAVAGVFPGAMGRERVWRFDAWLTFLSGRFFLLLLCLQFIMFRPILIN